MWKLVEGLRVFSVTLKAALEREKQKGGATFVRLMLALGIAQLLCVASFRINEASSVLLSHEVLLLRAAGRLTLVGQRVDQVP